MFRHLRNIITRKAFERAFRATLPAAQRAVERAMRHHKRPDAAALSAQREALHRALAHGRRAGA